MYANKTEIIGVNMGRIEPADFLNHYFPGYKNKIFSSDTIASFYSACSKLNLNVTEENIKFQFGTIIVNKN